MSIAKRFNTMIGALIRRLPQVQAELRESELPFQQLTENIREIFYIVDPEMTQFFHVSQMYGEIWGRSVESLYADPSSFIEGIHVEDRERAIQSIVPHGVIIPFEVEYRVVRPDDTVRWVRARGFPVRNVSGEVYRYAGIVEDITEGKQALEQISRQTRTLEQGNRRLSLLGEMTGLLQSVVTVEEAASIVGGYLEQIHVGGGGALYLFKESRNYLDRLTHWGEGAFPDFVLSQDCWALRRGQPYRQAAHSPQLYCKHTLKMDEPSESFCLPMMTEHGPLGLFNVVFTAVSQATRDSEAVFAERMSEQVGLALANFRLRETLRLQAMQDQLTGLFNRRFLEISLKREFARAAREESSVAVMMLDVDHFKRFNDTYGHNAGDVVLHQLGQILMDSCRAADLACRYGGEEFTVILPGASHEAAVTGAERLLEKVRDMRAIAEGVALPQVTISIGIAFFPEHGRETEEVIQAADRALYAAKEAGRDRYVVGINS